MENLFGKTKKECESIMADFGQKPFRGKQLYEWLYVRKAESLGECTDLSKMLRQQMGEQYEIVHGEIIRKQIDPEDDTTKYLIRLSDGNCIETVLMSYRHGWSICVSTQVGCAMGCTFCASTKGGKVRDLTAGEILDQIFLAERDKKIRIANVVVMGIGEPLDNYDELLKFIALLNKAWGIGQRKITVSTCGLIPQIEALAEENLQINLAISLHSPFQEEREKLMPIARKYKIKELIKSCNYYFSKTGRRISFEYALIEGINDREIDVAGLKQLFSDSPVHINLIRLNRVEENRYKGSKNVNFFCDALKKNGINCTIRRKIGRNIDAACGQLRRNVQKSAE